MGSLLPNSPHFVIFPFMAQGHTIPLLHLSRLLLLRRSAAVTVITTPGNSPSIRSSLNDTTGITILEIPFPQNIEGVPPGVENTQQLPSMLSFLPFASSTKLMKQSFEKALEALNPPASCIISDGFLGWTLESANRFGVPRFAFFGMGNFSSTMYTILGRERPHAETLSSDELFEMPGFPGLKLTRNDFEPPFSEIAPTGPYVEFTAEQMIYMARSHGVIVNSFVELERSYADYWNAKIGPKAFNVGPLCMAEEYVEGNLDPPGYVEFLDGKLAEGDPVLYVSFGTQARVSDEQLEEIAAGLERSGVSFLWAIKSDVIKIGRRGILVNGWVDQLRVLRHGGVKGILSHCGWNSVLESVSAGVPIIALPFIAEQHVNARFVAEVAGVGLRIMPEGGGSMRPHAETLSSDEPFEMPGFPGLKLTRNDFEPPFDQIEPTGPYAEFTVEQMIYMARSHGVIVNSFVELERSYADYWNAKIGPKAFNVGPLCMVENTKPCHVEGNLDPPSYVEFLDGKLAEGDPVLYVSFGTQARVSAEQLEEIAVGLERSGVSFLWAIKSEGVEFLEERVKIQNRGILVNGWVDQLRVLRHGGVKGFLSHCGWNSVVESVSAGVPIIALPFMAEQHVNARFVAEVAGVGLRIMPEGGGSMRGFVVAEEVERVVRELMGDGERGMEVRRKAAEYGAAARESMTEGGSSVRTLDELVDDISGKTMSFCASN